MPQNHRTFLYLSEESIAHLRPSLSAVYPLYFSFFPSPCPVSAQSPSIPSFSCSLVVCVNPFPHLHFFSSSPHPSLFLPSRSRPFPSLIDMFPFSKLRSLHHICSFFSNGHFSFAFFYPLLHHVPRVHLTPAVPAWLYFARAWRPLMGIAVLVRACDSGVAGRDGVLQGPTEWGSQKRSVTMQWTKPWLMISEIKQQKKDKRRKDITAMTFIHFTEQLCTLTCRHDVSFKQPSLNFAVLYLNILPSMCYYKNLSFIVLPLSPHPISHSFLLLPSFSTLLWNSASQWVPQSIRTKHYQTPFSGTSYTSAPTPACTHRHTHTRAQCPALSHNMCQTRWQKRVYT